MADSQPPAQLREKRYPWLVAARHLPRELPGIPRRLRQPAWFRYLTIIGPGIIAAAAGNDAGGIATYSAAGAKYGYQLLWAMVIITVSLIIVQEISARMGAVTGKGLSDLIREQFGVRWTAFAMLTLLVANAGSIVSEFAGIAAALELFGIVKYISVPVMAAVVWWLVVKGSYRQVERIFLVMTIGFLAYIVSASIAGPNWAEVAHNSVVPSLQLDAGYLVMIVALIGTTITPYMQIYQQSSVVEKGITIQEYPIERVDVVSGAIFSDIVSFFIIVATGATLFVQHVQVNTAADAAKALQPVAGPFAEALFAAGLFGASMLAAGVLPLATSFSLCEAFGWQAGLNEDFQDAPIFYSLFTGLVVLGALVTLIPGLPLIQLLLVVQVVNGLLLPVELIFIMILSNDRELMGKYANGPVFNVLAWATTATVSLLAILLVIITIILPIFGINLG